MPREPKKGHIRGLDPQTIRAIRAQTWVDLGEMDDRDWKAELLASSRINYETMVRHEDRLDTLEGKVRAAAITAGILLTTLSVSVGSVALF